jgi:hypothetical protein
MRCGRRDFTPRTKRPIQFLQENAERKAEALSKDTVRSRVTDEYQPKFGIRETANER